MAAALLLQRAGHRVTLFERFEAARPLGSGLILQPTGLGVLDSLGLVDAIMSRGSVIERLFGCVMPSGRVVLDVRYSAMAGRWAGLAVHRAALFDVLHDAVQAAGIAVVTSRPIGGSRIARDKRELAAEDGEMLGAFDLVVDASGTHSKLRPRVKTKVLTYGALWANVAFDGAHGFMPNALEQRYFRASQMAGILPTGCRAPGARTAAAFFWSIRRGDVNAWRDGGIGRWKEEVGRLWPECLPLLEDIHSPGDLTVAHYEHFTLLRPFDERIVQIGDAAHSTSPQLGQGANMALLDACALAQALDGAQDLNEATRRYVALRRWHVRLFQLASAAFTPFYQSDSRLLPIVRDYVAAPLSRLPVADSLLARLVSGLTVAPLGAGVFKPFETQRLRPETP
jgi:2-polyprenyl-6-methoxyphenol hydroxylase-like FAD-dependent oxidoreductase